ncbi:MAG: anaerobic ribonucleoside-triphosphate reductase activating protein [Treponema sp.]|nr:anaerobic ribonucleoside-triphosphate reductase activating protein [Treponema sp.]
MFYGGIKKFDIADGEGVRVSVFVSGCRNACKGCFQPQTWDFNYGKEFTSDTVDEILEALAKPFIQGLTILGGEPFEPENQPEVLELIQIVRKKFPQKDIWCWTGYVLETDLLPDYGRRHTEFTEEILRSIDVLVDGPFIEEKKDLQLAFRGSSNQRIIKMKEFFAKKDSETSSE